MIVLIVNWYNIMHTHEIISNTEEVAIASV